MNNKHRAQMVSGVLLFLSYFFAWSYGGGLTKESANDLANLELWGGTTPFLMQFLPLLPFVGVASIFMSWRKKYSYLYNLALSIFFALIIFRTWVRVNHLAMEFGFFLAIMGVAFSVYSLFIFKKDLNGAENLEMKMSIDKFYAIRKKFQKSSAK